jgi:hypothetical protein
MQPSSVFLQKNESMCDKITLNKDDKNKPS